MANMLTHSPMGQPTETLATTEIGAAAAMSREQAEVQAAVVMANRFPRDETTAWANVVQSCERTRFAEKPTCVYTFPRGGKTISGPGVALARELARCWRHLRYGIRIVAMESDYCHIKGYAYDCETNSYREMEDRFQSLVQRKNAAGETVWIKPDERDLRELICRRGAICVRNAILQLLPPDLVDEAVEIVRKTRDDAAKKIEGTNKWKERVKAVAKTFRTLKVTRRMLEAHLGHDLDTLTAEELVDLQGIFGSISDGNTAVETHFGEQANGLTPEPKPGQSQNEAIADHLTKPKEKPEPAAKGKPNPTAASSESAKLFMNLPDAQRDKLRVDYGFKLIGECTKWDAETQNDFLIAIKEMLARKVDVTA